MQAPLATLNPPGTARASVPAAGSHTARAAFAQAISAVLADLAALVAQLPDGRYSAASSATFRGASIGGHVRHILDHIAPIVDIAPRGVIDYDRRLRGTPIETAAAAALAELARIIAALALAHELPDTTVEVLIMPAPNAEPLRLGSSIERELAFALSHTIHHCASIRSIAVEFGQQTPAGFGLAPSTLAHEDASKCAR